ncbi:MAG: DUF1553 domain-containing protein [Cytophagaceae bacterium]|nr:DUF1553 domain-containing protein [Cytophagaceae bacterium]
MKLNALAITGILAAGIVGYFALAYRSDEVDFNTQVKPILNKNCIVCHGGVKRNADFSLLFRSEALAPTESGKPAIVPGDPGHSEFIKRLSYKDPKERMPLNGPPLKDEEIAILKKWVEQGAKWGNHWAYVAPKQPDVPKPGLLAGIFDFGKDDWAKNDIDYFVLDALKKEDLKPADEAARTTLLRRVSLDLTGLPPTVQQLARFKKEPSNATYEKLVDELLASPGFGERWGGMWLDLARYSDTKGYERDDKRDIWRYRDWVIRAFNENKPYNQFLTEQLAGDLLPKPTDNQLIATAFHRNTMTNDEGGTNNEEFRTAAVLDRVGTTWEVLQSTTFACVQCHSHPYDPFRHEDFYKFVAFFNNSRDEDTFGDYPKLRHLSDTLRFRQKLTSLHLWVKTNGSTAQASETTHFLKTFEPHVNSLVAEEMKAGALADEKWLALRQGGSARFSNIKLDGKRNLLVKFNNFIPNTTWEIHLDRPDGPTLAKIRIDTARLKPDGGYGLYPIQPTSGVHNLYFSVKSSDQSLKEKPEQTLITWDWFAFRDDLPGSGKPGQAEMLAAFWELVKARVPSTPIMQENPADMARKTNVFVRGNFLAKGKVVQPDVPHSLPPLPKDAPRNRLGLARWLTSPEHPLTARVAVNRFWEQLFGIGLVETLEDFGTQGFTPSHQELLDYLAVKFTHEMAWQPKALLKYIVTSATYRQDSKASKALLEKDPYNRLMARGPRIRLSAEQVRDQALAVSGLLSRKMYGPGVMPDQPEGVWQSPYNGAKWTQSEGEDRYRRAVYTYWKRTSPYPSMLAFDGSSREVCLARRIRTNTPLQALVTLNDPVYVEVSRQLAYRMEQAGRTPEQQIRSGYERVMAREIHPENLTILLDLYRDALKTYRAQPAEVKKLLKDSTKTPRAETAALTLVASTLVNLDEFITKE